MGKTPTPQQKTVEKAAAARATRKPPLRNLTVMECRRIASKGGDQRVRVAPGLYLRVQGGAASWVFRTTRTASGSVREKTIGSFLDLTLADATAAAADLLSQTKKRLDVFRDGSARGGDTFLAVAKAHIAGKRAGWSNPKHALQWESTLREYVYPILGSRRVSEITPIDVLAVLNQRVPAYKSKPAGSLWLARNETAMRVRGRIEAVLTRAKAMGLREWNSFNPAAWEDNLESLVEHVSRRARIRHQPAMPWRDAPLYVQEELSGATHISARALLFTILTAARTGEAIGAQWDEFDLDSGLWTIPAGRMKARKQHEVPLSRQAVELLRGLPRDDSGIVFPSPVLAKDGATRPLSNMGMLELLRGARPGLTVHGFRSTFRDWAAENTPHPREVIEHALAHKLTDEVEAAYARSTLLPKRRLLMQDWADYLNTPLGTV